MLTAISPGTVTAVTTSLARGWTLQFQGVVAAVNDPLCTGVLQLWYSRLSFIANPQKNKPSGSCDWLQFRFSVSCCSLLLHCNGCDCSSVWEVAPVCSRWCQSPARSWGAAPGLWVTQEQIPPPCVSVHAVTGSDARKCCPMTQSLLTAPLDTSGVRVDFFTRGLRFRG